MVALAVVVSIPATSIFISTLFDDLHPTNAVDTATVASKLENQRDLPLKTDTDMLFPKRCYFCFLASPNNTGFTNASGFIYCNCLSLKRKFWVKSGQPDQPIKPCFSILSGYASGLSNVVVCRSKIPTSNTGDASMCSASIICATRCKEEIIMVCSHSCKSPN